MYKVDPSDGFIVCTSLDEAVKVSTEITGSNNNPMPSMTLEEAVTQARSNNVDRAMEVFNAIAEDPKLDDRRIDELLHFAEYPDGVTGVAFVKAVKMGTDGRCLSGFQQSVSNAIARVTGSTSDIKLFIRREGGVWYPTNALIEIADSQE